MPYATQADLVARFGLQEIEQVTDLRVGMGVAADVVDRALADADAEIDARLAQRYTLPLASVPAVLVRVACDIARYHLWAQGTSETVRQRYTDALKVLDRIADGSIDMPAAQPLAPGAGAVAVLARSSPSQFAAGQLDSFSGAL
jgi:phage gp36-like protein